MTNHTLKIANNMLKPLFEERLKMYEENGSDWPDKPVSAML